MAHFVWRDYVISIRVKVLHPSSKLSFVILETYICRIMSVESSRFWSINKTNISSALVFDFLHHHSRLQSSSASSTSPLIFYSRPKTIPLPVAQNAFFQEHSLLLRLSGGYRDRAPGFHQ